ncbi:MAG TPA: adenylyltransferase/cytidyltransferase family protein [Patescibacteria group bacterium]|nr:adenylyltransferase/cytidyltransferase family protein [Patescibacteria group bacterium]
MGTILDLKNINQIGKTQRNNKILVLVGGCFDILHKGHIEFLKKAKEKGQLLAVLLEHDKRIKELKGEDRPINTQEERALILSNLSMIDYVIPLQHIKKDKEYEDLVKKIQPDIIAVTAGNTIFEWEKKYSQNKNIEIVEVIKPIPDYSTTNIIKKARV